MQLFMDEISYPMQLLTILCAVTTSILTLLAPSPLSGYTTSPRTAVHKEAKDPPPIPTPPDLPRPNFMPPLV